MRFTKRVIGGGENFTTRVCNHPRNHVRFAANMTTEQNIECVIPILDVEDVIASVAFFRPLGFEAYFVTGEPPDYACLRAGPAELHLRPKRLVRAPGPQSIRVRVREVRRLGEEFRSRGVTFVRDNRPTQELVLEDTAWGTTEFHVHEPNGHSVTFYQVA